MRSRLLVTTIFVLCIKYVKSDLSLDEDNHEMLVREEAIGVALDDTWDELTDLEMPIEVQKFYNDNCHSLSLKEYKKLRKELMKIDERESFGADLLLKGPEIAANECLMTAKYNEVNSAFRNPSEFLPAKNFAKVRSQIEMSKVFQIIRKMPKGAVFHAHSTAMTSFDYILDNMFNETNLYVCLENGLTRFRIMEKPNVSKCGNWQHFDTIEKKQVLTREMIRTHFDDLTGGFKKEAGLNEIWKTFEEIFSVLKGIMLYRPNFEKFFYQALQDLYDDNIMYVEIRSSLSKVYEINGTVHPATYAVEIYRKIVDKFVAEHPGFLGAKIIYSVRRNSDNTRFEDHVRIFRELRKNYPDFVVGFDLVGQEDKGETLKNFVEALLQLGKETQFFFHAGETNWYGHPTDENLFDAVLLNTKRIGHGYALLKHPVLMNLVKKRNITIELNPISNQVLKLVKDMRNHPAAYFFANNFPIVVSNDDPSLWGAKGLSYDFYEAFVGIMSRHADLRALKQLALNSIIYSTMTPKEQKIALLIWRRSWKKFVVELAEQCPVMEENSVESIE